MKNNKTMTAESIRESFVGKGKVAALKIEEITNGGFILHYKEGNKVDKVLCDDRVELEKILLEFGGKNPETCRAPDELLMLNGLWDSQTITDYGHKISKIQIKGMRDIRNDKSVFNIPKNVGQVELAGSMKDASIDNTMIVIQRDYETTARTITFSSPKEFDELQRWLLSDKRFKTFTWYVMGMVTESRASGKNCKWQRVKAGDGSKRMVLELIALDGKHYTECSRQELYDSADDMFYAPCQRVDVKKKDSHSTICLFAVEDGRIDSSKFDLSGEV